jgi:CheY-like chemotaxis protein
MAEDHDDVRETNRQILEDLGYRVLCARNGAEAVDLFETHQDTIDLVFLDVVMPVLSGPDASIQLLFLFATGYVNDAHLMLVRAHPNAVILQKPYDTQALSDKVRSVLDHKKE